MTDDTAIAKRYLPLPGSWHTLSTNQRMAIHLGLLGAAVLFVYYRTFNWLLQVWWTQDAYSHGFLIPLIAFYLVWIKWDQLAQLPQRPTLAKGGLLLFVSTIMLLAGRAGGSVLLEALSLLILLPGIVLFIWGSGHLRALMLPLGYLQFMIPWTDQFFAQASWPFQLFSARLASLLLQAVGISVLREATYLQFPHVTIEVVPSCSGLSLLYSILALSIPLVYLTQRTWWRAASVLVFGVAITILANGVRVALMGAVGSYSNGSTLHGPFHIFQGWFVAQGAILVLFLANWGVAKLPCGSRVRLYERWKGRTADVVPTNRRLRAAGISALLLLSLLALGYSFRQGWAVAQGAILVLFFLFLVYWAVAKLLGNSRVGLHERWKGLTADVVPTNTLSRTAGSSALLLLSLVGLGCYLQVFASPHPVPPKQSLADLPRVIGNWHAHDSAWIEGRRFFPGAAAEATRSYQAAEKEIFLYVGYFASQGAGPSLISGQSELLRRDARDLSLPKSIAGLQRVNHSAPMIDGKRYEALFWYHLPSGKTTGRYETKVRQLWDAVVRGHNNGAVVLLATPAAENQDSAATVNDLLEFVSVLAPVLEEYFP